MVIDYQLLYIRPTRVFPLHFSLLIDFLLSSSKNTRPKPQIPPRSLNSSSFCVIQSLNSYIFNLLFSLIYSFLTKTFSIKNPQFLKPYHGIFKKTFKAHNQEESS